MLCGKVIKLVEKFIGSHWVLKAQNAFDFVQENLLIFLCALSPMSCKIIVDFFFQTTPCSAVRVWLMLLLEISVIPCFKS